MGEYIFGVRKARKTQAQIRSVERAIEKAGLSVWVGGSNAIPGTGAQWWLCAQNRGAPFDQQTAEKTIAALQAAGITW